MAATSSGRISPGAARSSAPRDGRWNRERVRRMAERSASLGMAPGGVERDGPEYAAGFSFTARAGRGMRPRLFAVRAAAGQDTQHGQRPGRTVEHEAYAPIA